MALFSKAPDSLCILRLSAIGDVCNTIAVVQAIQRSWPKTKITWITGKLEASLISDLPGIEVIIFDKKQGWKAYTSVWHKLKGRHFDALLHMQYAIRASILTLGIKAHFKLGFDKKRSQDFQQLFTNIKVPSPQSMHVLDGLMAFVEVLGIKDLERKWILTYSDSDQAWASSHLSIEKKTVVIVPAASKAYKNWMVDGYRHLIEHIHAKGWNCILAGSPAPIELTLSQQITDKLSFPILNLVGESSLKEMLALLDNADLVIAPDTGPAHMANAMSTPVIGLYAHHNPLRTGPYRYQQYVVSAYEEALFAETQKSPSEVEWRTRVKDKDAMKRIKVEQVTAMFDQFNQQTSRN